MTCWRNCSQSIYNLTYSGTDEVFVKALKDFPFWTVAESEFDSLHTKRQSEMIQSEPTEERRMLLA